MELTGCTASRWDRNKVIKRSGLCINVHDNWCTNVNIVNSHCSPDLEYLTVKCRPFYLPREFTAVKVTVVYIPLNANANTAQSYLL